MSWKEETFIAIDLETSGSNPLFSEICEIGAAKWRAGKLVDKYQVLIKPTHKMDDEIIAIHGITNEMVKDAPSIESQIKSFYDFLQDGIILAHHAPFDMGFLAHEFEKANLKLPFKNVICTSLLSRKVIPESPNHKLVTLRKFLNLESNTAHRAYDDSFSCLELAIKCFERMGDDAGLTQIYERQGGGLNWYNFSLVELQKEPHFEALMLSLLDKKCAVQVVYMGGSQKGKWRTIYPVGIVRSPQGDYLVARDEPDGYTKRFYLKKLTDSKFIS